MNEEIGAVAFDAYGTLFDVYSIGTLAESIFAGHGAALAEAWRIAQIDYTRVRTLSDRYIDFWAITGDGLDFAAARLGLDLDAAARTALLDQYAELAAYPEIGGVLDALKAVGLAVGILSNGTPTMLAGAIAAAGLEGRFDHVLSVEAVGRFKTAPEAYRLGVEAFGRPASEILFVSSNGWDVCGAAWFGYRTFWVNRSGAVLDRLGVTPDGEGRDLSDLPRFVATLG